MSAPDEGMRYGEAAYDAYCAAVGGRSAITGDPLPTFEAQRPGIQEAWAAAARAARELDADPVQ